MKKLSIEQKAKLYDKALEKARQLCAYPTSKPFISDLQDLFPELKENEDENVRKSIIAIINNYVDNSNTFKPKMIAWLKKQGEQKPILPKWKYKKDNTPLLKDSLILNKYGCVAKSPSGALVSDVWVMDYDELAKLPKEDFEEQNEQKPADKVEPKFKVGDWIVGANSIYKITSLNDELSCYIAVTTRNEEVKIPYYFDCTQGHMCSYHLWTIKDVKDGDVLAVEPRKDYHSPFIAIYKEHGLNFFNSHCFVSWDGEFHEGTTGHSISDIHPATKEQRDFLFQKMKEAGYELDDEKKELKKIEQKPADNIELSTFKDKLLELFQRFHWYCKDKTPTNGEILEYVDAHIQELINTIQNNAWSEEDG